MMKEVQVVPFCLYAGLYSNLNDGADLIIQQQIDQQWS